MGEQITGYHQKFSELATDLVNHGWGELIFKVESPFKDSRVRIIVKCGKEYIFFIKKNIDFDTETLL